MITENRKGETIIFPGLNLDDLLAAQQTAIKAVSELRRVISELESARATIAELQQQQRPPVNTGSAG